MSRIDWLVLRRVFARLTLTVLVFFALMALVESLNTSKFRMLSALGGPLLAITGIVLSALRASIGVLPVTVLIGTIAGVLDLQSRRELTIIQATGHSIWRVVRAPLLLVLLLASAISIGGETLLILGNRAMSGEPISNQVGVSWMEQRDRDGAYVLQAQRLTANPPELYGVTIFLTGLPNRDRIEAETAELRGGKWLLATGTRYRLDKAPEALRNFELGTQTTVGDLSLDASGARDLTLPELLTAYASSISENGVRAVTLTSLFRTFTLPLMVVGSMLIGFATAASYRRNVQYANTVLFGIVAGFVLFVLNEMAVRAGNADVLPPLIAAAGPAVVSILVGVTALLYSQDGTIRR